MKYVVIWIGITLYMLLKLIQYVLICVIINLIWDFKILPWGFYNTHTIYVFSEEKDPNPVFTLKKIINKSF